MDFLFIELLFLAKNIKFKINHLVSLTLLIKMALYLMMKILLWHLHEKNLKKISASLIKLKSASFSDDVSFYYTNDQSSIVYVSLQTIHISINDPNNSLNAHEVLIIHPKTLFT